MAKEKRKPLGRGIDSLFLDADTDYAAGGDPSSAKTSLYISEIEPRRDQPRKHFDQQALAQLADSIAANGLIQPIVVRARDNSDFYQIIAGERRWRAAKMAGLTEVPVVILEADEKKAAEYALIENIQREDLNPIEEALGFKSLIDDYNLTQEETARQVGKSRAAVTNSLRLLDLPKEVLSLVEEKSISAGHARALLGISDKSQINTAAKTVVERELSVRATEELVKKINSAKKFDESPNCDTVEREYYSSLAQKITEALGAKVKLYHISNNKSISISYTDNDQLEDIIRKLIGNENADKLFI